jgi:hypothetical protein
VEEGAVRRAVTRTERQLELRQVGVQPDDADCAHVMRPAGQTSDVKRRAELEATAGSWRHEWRGSSGGVRGQWMETQHVSRAQRAAGRRARCCFRPCTHHRRRWARPANHSGRQVEIRPPGCHPPGSGCHIQDQACTSLLLSIVALRNRPRPVLHHNASRRTPTAF